MSRHHHALYPGSFDVLTYGHLDVLRRAARIFDRVTIAVAVNPAKSGGVFDEAQRLQMLRESTGEFSGVDVQSFRGLTVEFARSIGAEVILRGLRAVSDYEFEFQMAMMNDSLAPEITTIFMAPSPQFSFLSSSLVREISRFGGDVSPFVPPHVARELTRSLTGSSIHG